MLSQQLIENALALCGKTMDYIIVEYNCGFLYDGPDIRKGLSIEKFFYSLLDRQFLIKYYQNQKPGYLPSTETTDGILICYYGIPIRQGKTIARSSCKNKLNY